MKNGTTETITIWSDERGKFYTDISIEGDQEYTCQILERAIKAVKREVLE